MYGISHAGIRCENLERSIRFYTEGLGGTKGAEYFMPSGSHLIFIDFKDFSVELICRPDDVRIPGRNHLAFDVASIRDAVAKLQCAGVAVSEADIHAMGDSAKNCFVTGPDGELIELCEGSLN